MESRQIAVCKTDKALLELVDSLKPSGDRFPAHIHAAGEKEENRERSLIRLQMVDYSKGTGMAAVQVFANISPRRPFSYTPECTVVWKILPSALIRFSEKMRRTKSGPL